MAVIHFVTHVKHVSRHFEVCSKNKNTCLGKTVLKMWSQIYQKKIAYLSIKLPLEKSPKKNIYIYIKTFTIFGSFWQISDTTFSKPFSRNIFFNFLFQTPKCLETCVNCVKKCVTGKTYPTKVQILQTIFFKVTLRTIQAMFPQF